MATQIIFVIVACISTILRLKIIVMARIDQNPIKAKAALLNAFGLVTCLFIFACGGNSDEQDRYRHKIKEWQSREQLAPDIESECSYSGSIGGDLVKMTKSIDLEYMADSPKYWRTSAETIENGGGDCSDLSAYVYRFLINSCLPEYYDIDIRMRVVDLPNIDSNHVIVVVYHTDAFYEIDNLLAYYGESDNRIIAEFDLWQQF